MSEQKIEINKEKKLSAQEEERESSFIFLQNHIRSLESAGVINKERANSLMGCLYNLNHIAKGDWKKSATEPKDRVA